MASDKRFMLCEDGTGSTEKILASDQWILEEKLDGERCQLSSKDGIVALLNRHGRDITKQFPELQNITVASLTTNVVLDGEIIIPAHSHLQGRPSTAGRCVMGPGKVSIASKFFPATFMAFDCLELGAKDLRREPYEKRKAALAATVIEGPRIHSVMPLNIDIPAEEIWKEVQARGLEGLVAKRVGSIYEGRRSSSWLKLKTWQEDDFNVLGFTSEKREISALILEGGTADKPLKVNFGVDEATYNHYLPLLKANATAYRAKVRFLTRSATGLRFPNISEIYEVKKCQEN